MRRMVVTALFVSIVIGLCAAQSTAPQAAAAANEISGSFPTTLYKSLDSKKLKEGDPVICQTAGVIHSRSGIMVPSGSKVIGHVTVAKARSKGDSESTLGIAFDKIEISKGKDIPMKGTLQAIAPSLGDGGPMTAAGSGQMMAGHSSGTDMAPATDSGAVAGPNSGVRALSAGGAHPILIRDSQGVLGFKNLQMGKDSVISSSGKEIKLDSGTQMMIHAEIAVPTE